MGKRELRVEVWKELRLQRSARTAIEWRVAFGLWGALALGISQASRFDGSETTVKILAYGALVVHVFWLVFYLQASNRRDSRRIAALFSTIASELEVEESPSAVVTSRLGSSYHWVIRLLGSRTDGDFGWVSQALQLAITAGLGTMWVAALG